MAVRAQNVVDLRWQLEAFWVFGIVRNEGIDQDVRSMGGLDQNSGMAEPCDVCFL
jgi:hypothetical protein